MADERGAVSFATEELVLVDEEDREVGTATKAEAHAGEGVLHRAFSVFLFDERGRVLVQRRADEKPLWPGFWSNSCCSHPRHGESMEAATRRRVREELGLEAELAFLYKFRYHVPYGTVGSEHELCWVFAGRTEGEPQAHPEEIAELRWMEPEALDREMAEHPDRFTPWFRMEWPRLRAEHRDELTALAAPR